MQKKFFNRRIVSCTHFGQFKKSTSSFWLQTTFTFGCNHNYLDPLWHPNWSKSTPPKWIDCNKPFFHSSEKPEFFTTRIFLAAIDSKSLHHLFVPPPNLLYISLFLCKWCWINDLLIFDHLTWILHSLFAWTYSLRESSIPKYLFNSTWALFF